MLAFAMLLFSSACDLGVSEASVEERCEIARSYLEAQLTLLGDEQIVFGTEPALAPLPGQNTPAAVEKAAKHFTELPWSVPQGGDVWNGRTASERRKSDRDVDLFRQWVRKTPQANAVATCPSVRSLLKSHEIEYGDEAVAAARAERDDPDAAHEKTIAKLLLPEVSRDGASALLEDGRQWAWLAGYGAYVRLHRDEAGGWRVIGIDTSWIS